jgi:hypothetical protein
LTTLLQQADSLGSLETLREEEEETSENEPRVAVHEAKEAIQERELQLQLQLQQPSPWRYTLWFLVLFLTVYSFMMSLKGPPQRVPLLM